MKKDKRSSKLFWSMFSAFCAKYSADSESSIFSSGSLFLAPNATLEMLAEQTHVCSGAFRAEQSQE